ncbi:sugar phosphate nucleotidyltransferase [Litorivicinus sp.]|nr:sugar phosphate nucleotidyltransferase [Litorivicinus sp.]MDC1239985.1 sugar phosphate nucleotidyltransferase [Litorivicinus sp.]
MKGPVSNLVQISATVREAVSIMSQSKETYCICVNSEEKVVGMFTDGDFRAGVFAGMQLDDPVGDHMNSNFFFLESPYDDRDIAAIYDNTIAQQLPVLRDGFLVDVVFRKKFEAGSKSGAIKSINSSVVIMAGGKGSRLDPFTRILPKPLIPLGNDPVIKVIMDKFGQFGLKEFYISVNEKSRMIKAYFNDHDLPYNIQYLDEDQPLGTVGALKILDGKLDSPVFVTNCDIIANTDYSKLMDFHIDGGYDLTLVGAMQNFTIPYGICEVRSDGSLIAIKEKPKYDFLVNTGLYVLNPDILCHIPSNTYFDITDLINIIILEKGQVGVFPISEHDWIDIGQWSEYREAVGKLGP